MIYSYTKSILIRYFILFILGIGGLFLIYLIITPLTLYPVYFFLNLQHGAILQSSGISSACDITTSLQLNFISSISCVKTTIYFRGYYATLVPACIAGAAVYLLLILNLTTQMNVSKRLKSISFLIFSFLLINITRIIIFANIYTSKGFDFFDIAHRTTWYFGSTVLVVLIWFSNILIFKIKEIPIYSEIKSAFSHLKSNSSFSNIHY